MSYALRQLCAILLILGLSCLQRKKCARKYIENKPCPDINRLIFDNIYEWYRWNYKLLSLFKIFNSFCKRIKNIIRLKSLTLLYKTMTIRAIENYEKNRIFNPTFYIIMCIPHYTKYKDLCKVLFYTFLCRKSALQLM